MKNQEMNQAVAVACGYGQTHNLPDYGNDLNAMREVRKTLNREQQNKFVDHLKTILARVPTANLWFWALIDCDASQQREAFLKTLGLWKE